MDTDSTPEEDTADMAAEEAGAEGAEEEEDSREEAAVVDTCRADRDQWGASELSGCRFSTGRSAFAAASFLHFAVRSLVSHATPTNIFQPTTSVEVEMEQAEGCAMQWANDKKRTDNANAATAKQHARGEERRRAE